ncbi:unnamed protein product [Onchocerca flexuosa]|uniref:Amine oxidase n=1 Tax=Onchocerca flexuosa TaxID=387005 RepID=A0A183H5E5_9BILA|nr:unnamed protein product [Onchocerca flexuosa]
MHADILLTQCCCYRLAVVRGGTIIFCNFIYIIKASSMAEEYSLASYDKDDTLKNTGDDMTIMSVEDSIGCVYGKLVLLGMVKSKNKKVFDTLMHICQQCLIAITLICNIAVADVVKFFDEANPCLLLHYGLFLIYRKSLSATYIINIIGDDKIKYNGTLENSNTYAQGRKHRSKMILRKRLTANGIKKDQSSSVSIPPSQSQVVRDASRHVVSYSYNRNHTVLVEYSPDPYKDMFQIGRSSEEQIDFTVVDTWLAANAFHPGSFLFGAFCCKLSY